jgi:hypothetical protein
VRQVPPPLPHFPAPRRSWAGMTSPIPRMCIECGAALPPTRRRFCSTECAMAWHVAMTALAIPSDGIAVQESLVGGRRKNRRHLIARRRWDALNTPGEGVWIGKSRRPSPSQDRLRQEYKETIAPRSRRWQCRRPRWRKSWGCHGGTFQMIRAGYIPHPRHFEKLAKLAGADVPR